MTQMDTFPSTHFLIWANTTAFARINQESIRGTPQPKDPMTKLIPESETHARVDNLGSYSVLQFPHLRLCSQKLKQPLPVILSI